jgi:hypothetical protein
MQLEPLNPAEADPVQPTDAFPALLIFGDSHTAALNAGAQAERIETGLLYLSGNIWHTGLMRTHPLLGLDQPGSRYVRRRVSEAREAMQGELFRKGEPVIASAGYHLGRLLPPMTHNGHTTDIPLFDQDPDAAFMSASLFEAMISARRRSVWRLLKQVDSLCDLTVIAPPILSDHPMQAIAAGLITRRLRALGLNVFDPREVDGDLGRVLPDAWRAPDGVHGNAAYGQAVIRYLTTE